VNAGRAAGSWNKNPWPPSSPCSPAPRTRDAMLLLLRAGAIPSQAQPASGSSPYNDHPASAPDATRLPGVPCHPSRVIQALKPPTARQAHHLGRVVSYDPAPTPACKGGGHDRPTCACTAQVHCWLSVGDRESPRIALRPGTRRARRGFLCPSRFTTPSRVARAARCGCRSRGARPPGPGRRNAAPSLPRR